MYAVEDETFRQARSVVSVVAAELARQGDAGVRQPVDLHELVRRSTDAPLPENGEAAYLSGIAANLARLFSVEEMFPRKRRAGR